MGFPPENMHVTVGPADPERVCDICEATALATVTLRSPTDIEYTFETCKEHFDDNIFKTLHDIGEDYGIPPEITDRAFSTMRQRWRELAERMPRPNANGE